MKKLLIAIIALGSLSAFATTTVECKSVNYSVVVSDIEEFSFANYGINGVMNDGADVEVSAQYVSDKVIAFGLTVDGQEAKFEVAATKAANGKYIGKILTGKSAQDAVCTRK